VVRGPQFGERCSSTSTHLLMKWTQKHTHIYIIYTHNCDPWYVGPCHLSMASTEVANEGTASNMESNYEHNTKAGTDT
jgi:hypothetical protein